MERRISSVCGFHGLKGLKAVKVEGIKVERFKGCLSTRRACYGLGNKKMVKLGLRVPRPYLVVDLMVAGR